MATLPAALPVSRIPDPRAAPPLRWGILAAGHIADLFVDALATHTSQVVAAVGSRSPDRARAFAARHGIERAHGSYAALVADPGVDAVYVASPHSEHRAHALLAIAAGKHVLVEKAFTRNAAEARAVTAAAAAAGVCCLEAMWTRFLPQTDVIRQLLADGTLGEVATVLADHGQQFRHVDATNRLLNPDLAGGALLDLGIYPVSFAAFVMGAPATVAAHGSLAPTGVDAQVSISLATPTVGATLHTTLLAETPTTAAICGDRARIELTGPFYAPAVMTVAEVRGTAPPLVRPRDEITGHGGLCYEACELARCVRAGRVDSPLLPPAETVAIMETMDEIRRQVGVRYPGE